MKQSDVYKLHQKYAHGKYKKETLEIVWTHSLIIKSIASQIADDLEKEYGIRTDRKLIETGALLHDIGIYNCYDDDYKKICKYILHGKIGYDILIKDGVSQKRARFALVHVGVGISKEQIKKDKIDLPEKSMVPISLEEEIVCYADSFHSKGHPGFNNFEEEFEDLNKIDNNYGAIYKRYHEKFGIPNLTDLISKYEYWHKKINEWVESARC